MTPRTEAELTNAYAKALVEMKQPKYPEIEDKDSSENSEAREANTVGFLNSVVNFLKSFVKVT